MIADLTCVLAERRGPVGLGILNRPEKLNAMSSRLTAEMVRVLDAFEADDEIRVIVLTGAGDRAFSAGGDLNEVRERVGPNARRAPNPPLGERIRACRKPVIAAIRGYCYGGAAALVLNCDIRICGDDAKTRFIGASYGGIGGGALLPRIVGEAKAKELLLTTDVVPAAEALRIGLANQVVPAAEVVDYAVAMGERIAANHPRAVLGYKEIVNAALPVEEALAREAAIRAELQASEDTAARFNAAAERVVGPRS
ncbi:MAG: enoyl-CoA hydratase/isomerase family protein [Chloroflexota bacterium]|nr:enoyl-CoA hydratase/isomerase family protein [Chloroflexota bacterium]